jgi:hypothetical protein
VVCMSMFELNMDARQNVYFGRYFALLKYFIYLLVPLLAPNYKQHIFLPAKVSFLCCNTRP